jgi:hypothetical protein
MLFLFSKKKQSVSGLEINVHGQKQNNIPKIVGIDIEFGHSGQEYIRKVKSDRAFDGQILLGKGYP